MLFKSPRGTKDILPQESGIWLKVEEKARSVFSLFAYEEIRTPIIEESKLFSRSLGDLTDIVQKQMFLINKETDTFVLRPEATASIVRSYVENTLYNVPAVSKFYYMGPMFRAERPQKGRLRQFHHIGCEAIGSYSPYLDAEAIALASRIISSLGITGHQIIVNTLGCLNDKKSFALNLREKLLPQKKSFCEDCQSRMAKNVFRVLDCKNKQCKDIILAMNLGVSHICQECRKHFDDVRIGLDLFGVSYEVNPLLVRGLDYYTRTVFEITHKDLGSQDALGAGGRYDNLVEELGGPARGAVGFALGVERLLLAGGGAIARDGEGQSPDCYIIPLGDEAFKACLKVLQFLRDSGINTDIDYLEGSLKSKMRRADKSQAGFCLILGDNELAKGTAVLKNMRASTQEEVNLTQLVEKIKVYKPKDGIKSC
ncbi:MAG TPA: histidine--tRNA ligase [Candidatus Omnitrophica bacterium]|nr:histidine--tRNA ligase [Candidatus Omnitrophota bacterium]